MHPYTGAVTNVSARAAIGEPAGDIYDTLLDANRHGTVAGRTVRIAPIVGTEVSLDDGRAEGYVTELLEGRHIVLALRFADERWPPDHYSTVTFMLKPDGAGSTLVIFQQDVPEELAADLTAMWQREYMDKLTAAFPFA
jgi:activator of HSP90 ATPase